MTRSIYKNDHGRQTMHQWYDHFLGRLAPARLEHRQVDTRYGMTNVLLAGDPSLPPLWCFHGAMASAPAALAQVPGLLEHFHIIFPDTIGQPGRSSETRLDWQGDEHGHWVVDIMDAMEVTSIRALGVSLGGYVLLRAAERAPDRIERAGLWVPGGIIKPSMRNMLSLIGSGLMYALRPTQERLKRVMAATFTDFDDDYVAFFGDSLAHVHPDRRFPSLLKDGSLDSWNAPVMLVTHELDSVFPAADVERRAASLIPNVENVTRVAGVRHMPPFDNALLDPILDPMIAFLKA